MIKKLTFFGLNSNTRYGKLSRKNSHTLKNEKTENLALWDVVRTLRRSLTIIDTSEVPKDRKLSTLETFTVQYLRCIHNPELSTEQSVELKNKILEFINYEYKMALSSRFLPDDNAKRNVYVLRNSIEQDFYNYYYAEVEPIIITASKPNFIR